MANYAVNPAVLSPFLPAGVTLDLFDGKAYVSLVGFLFKDTKLFNIPIPWFGTFEEINLRFYVSRIENGKVKRRKKHPASKIYLGINIIFQKINPFIIHN